MKIRIVRNRHGSAKAALDKWTDGSLGHLFTRRISVLNYDAKRPKARRSSAR